MKLKRVLSAVLAFTTLALSTFSTVGTANAVEVETKDTPTPSSATVENESSSQEQLYDYGLCDNIQDGAILHAFCWRYDVIAANMDKIAAAGFTAVQTSPASRCYHKYKSMLLMGDKTNEYRNYDESTQVKGDLGVWWWQYQPVELVVDNYQLGNLADYKSMCEEADKYGVKIITDVVLNHTTAHYYDDEAGNEDSLLGYALEGDYANIDNLYHDSGEVDRPKIGASRYQYINYKNGGLPDVNTENPEYQKYVLTFLNDLINAGCDGFRFDMARNIGINGDPTSEGSYSTSDYTFWDVVTGKQNVANSDAHLAQVSDDFFFYGEILGDSISESQFKKYAEYINITDSEYGEKLRYYIGQNGFGADEIRSWYHKLSSDNLVTWVESHDTYCNFDDRGKHDSAWLSNEQIKLCWAVIAARSGGTPLYFNRPAGSNGRANIWGDNILGARGDEVFQSKEVAEVNKFRNAMAGENEKLRNINNDNQILQIDRGKNGTCIINLKNTSVTINTLTNLKDGTYIDTVSNNIFTVENGYIKGTLNKRSVSVIYQPTKMKLSANPSTAVFKKPSLDVTLNAANMNIGTSGTYTITVDGENIEENKAFNNGDVITIGNDVSLNSSTKTRDIILTLTSRDLSGNDITRKYLYTKKSPNAPTYIYFENTSNWSSVYAYVYNDDGLENGSWPGQAMTYDSTLKMYKYKLPNNLTNGYVIFNNNSGTQYPGLGITGLELNDQTMKFQYSNLSWEEYTAPADDNAIPDEDTDLKTYNYVYFFNSQGWSGTAKAVLKNGNTSKEYPLTESPDLHCYYCKYPVSVGYTTVNFSMGSDSTGAQTLTPGLVFVPTTFNDGEWITANNIIEHTIYFEHSLSWTNGVNIYLEKNVDGVTFKNADKPGESMIKMYDDAGKENNYNYSYTYYYPKLSEDNIDYGTVTFYKASDNNDNTYTESKNIISGKVNKFCSKGKNNTSTYKFSEPTGFQNKDISVNIIYSNYRVANANNYDTKYFEETKTTTATATITNGDFKTAIANACNNLNMSNAYDELVFCGSQFEYVKELASLDDNRIAGITPYEETTNNTKNTLPYSASINPSSLAYQNSSFSGVFADSSKFIENLDNAVFNDKWITYYSNGKEIDFNKLNPSDLPSDLSVTVYCFCKPKEYNITFHYPTESDSTIELNNSNLCTKQNDGVIYSCYYNQLIDETGKSNIVPDMKVPSGYRFDGWYTVTFNGNTVQSYLKISSEQEYKYRVTDKMDLYAVFTKENTLFTPGATAYAGEKNGVEKFVDGSTVKYRYNTVLNVYDCDDYGTADDTLITDVAVVYVKASTDNYVLSTTKQNLLSIVKSAETADNRKLTNQSVAVKTGTTANCNCYSYKVGDGTNGTVKLTAKNRLQFILTLTENQVNSSYGNVLAFTAFKIGDSWTISDNCVYYKNGTGENVMISNSN